MRKNEKRVEVRKCFCGAPKRLNIADFYWMNFQQNEIWKIFCVKEIRSEQPKNSISFWFVERFTTYVFHNGSNCQ